MSDYSSKISISKKLNLPNLGDEIYALQPCDCIKEKHKCTPNAVNSTVLQIIPISTEDKVRKLDYSHYTKQCCLRLYKRNFGKHHINQWGTRVFRTKEDALDSIGKRGNYYDSSNKSINN